MPVPVPCNGAWSSATISGSGTVNVNNQTFAHVLSIQTSANSIFCRQYLGAGSAYNYLPGTNSTWDFSKPFKLAFAAQFKVGGSGVKFTLQLGLAAAPTVHTLGGKGFAVCIDGTGSLAGTVKLCAHNGTSQTDSATASILSDGSMCACELQWVPGTGLYLTVNGVLAASLTTGLPSGTVANSNGWAILAENPTSTFVSQVNIYPMTVYIQ